MHMIGVNLACVVSDSPGVVAVIVFSSMVVDFRVAVNVPVASVTPLIGASVLFVPETCNATGRAGIPTPDEFAKVIDRDLKKWSAVIKEAGITAGEND